MAAAEFVAEGNAAASWRQGGATDDSDDVESEGCSTPMLVAIVAGGVAAAIGLVFVIWCVFCQPDPPAPDGKPPAPDVKPPAPEEVKTPARQAGVTDIDYAEAKTGVKVVGAFPSRVTATKTGTTFTVKPSPMSEIKSFVPTLSFNMFAVDFQNEKDAVTFDEQVNQATLAKDFVTHFRSDPGCDKNDCDPKKAQHQLVVKTLSPREAQRALHGTEFPYAEMYVTQQSKALQGAAKALAKNPDHKKKQDFKQARGLATLLTRYHDEATGKLIKMKDDLTANLNAKSLGLNEDTPTFADDDSEDTDDDANSNGSKVCKQTAQVMQTFYRRHPRSDGVLPAKVSLLDLSPLEELAEPTGTDRIKDAEFHSTTPLFAVQKDLAENGVRGELEFIRDIWPELVGKGKAKAGPLNQFTARSLVGSGREQLTRMYGQDDPENQIKLAKRTKAANTSLTTVFKKFCQVADRDKEAKAPHQAMRKGLPFGNDPLKTIERKSMTGEEVAELRAAVQDFVDKLIVEAEAWSKIMKSLGQGLETEAATKMQRLDDRLNKDDRYRELARKLEVAQKAADSKGYSLPETIRFVIVAGRIRNEGLISRDVWKAVGMDASTWEWPTRIVKSGAKKTSFYDVPREVVNEAGLDEDTRKKMHSIVSKVDFKRVNAEHTTDNMLTRTLDFGKGLTKQHSIDPVFEARARLDDMFAQWSEAVNRSKAFSKADTSSRNFLKEALQNVEISRAANYEAPKRATRAKFETIRSHLAKQMSPVDSLVKK